MLEVRVLGQFDVRVDGDSAEIPSRPAQSLLAYLMLNAGAAQRREKLAGLFWADAAEANARSNLRHALWRIRQAIETDGREYIFADNISITFNGAADYWLDAAALTRGDSTDDLIQSLSLYQGELLPGFYEEWVDAERERLNAMFEHRAQTLLDRLTADERWRDVLHWSEKWIAQGHAPEPAYRALMLAHHHLDDRLGVASAYQRCVDALHNELNIEPSEQTRSLYQQLTTVTPPAAAPPLAASPSAAFDNIPSPTTAFIGRSHLLAEIKDRCADPACRLITLVGPGGVGKTRLAIQAAYDHLGDFTDGACFVSLAAVSGVEYLASAIADALRLSVYGGTDLKMQLLAYLRDKSMLLVMDNFEHLVEGASLLAEILANAPRIKMFATSRERLNLHGEWLVEVGGMTVPPDASAEEFETFSSVRLFLQSARRVNPSFALADGDRAHVAHICQLVEGFPLGIELAAAWVRTIPCRDIAKEIERNLDFLSTTLRDVPERHRSLRAVFDHSWNLLAADEQHSFLNLSVFRGGFAREAAEEVAGASLNSLLALVDKSLLRRAANDRYEMHELLRSYTRDRLRELDEHTAIRARHLNFFLKMAETADPYLRAGDQLVWLERLEREHDNFRTALKWSLDGGSISAGLRLAGALARFWYLRGHWMEGRKWLDKILKVALKDDPAARVKALCGAGWLADEQGPDALFYQEGLALAREIDDRWSMAISLRGLGVAALGNNELDQADLLFNESLSLFTALRDQWGQAAALYNMGWLQNARGDTEGSAQLWEDGLRLFRDAGDRWGMAVTLNALSYLLRYAGDYSRATKLTKESLTLFRELGDKSGIANSLGRLATVALRRGDYEQASDLCEESIRLQNELGAQWSVVSGYSVLGIIAGYHGDYVRAQKLSDQALSIIIELGSRSDAAFLLYQIALIAYWQGDQDRATSLWEETLTIVQQQNDAASTPYPLNGLGLIEACRGNYERANELLNESLSRWRSLGDRRGVTMGIYSLGRLSHLRGDEPRAAALFKESLTLRQGMGDKHGVADSLEGLAGTLGTWKTRVAAEKAARMLGMADRLREVIGAPIPPVDRPIYNRDVARLRDQLGEESFNAFWATGRAMPVEQIVGAA